MVSNAFNEYFINVIKELGLSCNPESDVNANECTNFKSPIVLNSFSLRPVDEREVEKIIGSLKNKLSAGFDDVPVTVIKAVKRDISKILCHLINSSFVSGIFPKKLKLAKVIPLHKKDDVNKIQNYRPISILPSISKVYEKAVYIQITEYLEKFNLLGKNQHGFRRGKSVVTAVTSFIESIIESVDKGRHTTGIFMDLSKAFDSVKHTILLQKLKDLGLSKTSLNWFQSYLSNRTQYVEITHLTHANKLLKSSSNYRELRFGVPQGSILGPLLFLCYVRGVDNVLTNKPYSKICLYADDSNLIISSNSQQENEVQAFVELENIGSYFQKINLLLNSQKTNSINFKTRQNKNHLETIIMYDEQHINIANSTNFLGLTLDQHLNWNEHVHKVLIKINSGIYALSKMRFYCNLPTLKNIYFAYVHSHISFCLSIYGSTTKLNMDNILKQQKRAIRVMLNLRYDDSVKDHFKNLKIQTVYGQYIFDTVLLVKFYLLENHLTFPSHPYNTRNKNEVIPAHRLKFFEKKPTYVGHKFLAFIPEHIKKESNFNKFKKILKDYLVNQAFYSVQEFFTSLKK